MGQRYSLVSLDQSVVDAGATGHRPRYLIAEWVAASGVAPSALLPGDKSLVDATAWEEMRAFRGPFIFLHEQVFLVLVGAVILHIAGVVVDETRERNGIVSAMFTGDKMLRATPVDLPVPDEAGVTAADARQ